MAIEPNSARVKTGLEIASNVAAWVPERRSDRGTLARQPHDSHQPCRSTKRAEDERAMVPPTETSSRQ